MVKRVLNISLLINRVIKDDELSEKYNKILEKVRNSIKKEFDGEPVYNEKCLKTLIKSYEGKINTIVTVIKYQKKVPNVFSYR